MINGWLNIYKPTGITSAQMVAAVKRILDKPKIGHTGTLDPEAEGILPLALGEATKLSHILVDAKKTYRFKIQFGTRTNTADREGVVIDSTDNIPSKEQCHEVISRFIGEIEQIPPIFSALKVNGKRAYTLARNNEEVILAPRKITIFALELLGYNHLAKTAIYEVECSKGTYIRTLAEDIAFSLQSLGFVLELARTKVGGFLESDSINFHDLALLNKEDAHRHLLQKISRVDSVLDDISVLDIDDAAAYKIRCGQKVDFESEDHKILWLRHQNKLLAIGSLCQGRFDSMRVFNL